MTVIRRRPWSSIEAGCEPVAALLTGVAASDSKCSACNERGRVRDGGRDLALPGNSTEMET